MEEEVTNQQDEEGDTPPAGEAILAEMRKARRQKEWEHFAAPARMRLWFIGIGGYPL